MKWLTTVPETPGLYIFKTSSGGLTEHIGEITLLYRVTNRTTAVGEEITQSSILMLYDVPLHTAVEALGIWAWHGPIG